MPSPPKSPYPLVASHSVPRPPQPHVCAYPAVVHSIHCPHDGRGERGNKTLRVLGGQSPTPHCGPHGVWRSDPHPIPFSGFYLFLWSKCSFGAFRAWPQSGRGGLTSHPTRLSRTALHGGPRCEVKHAAPRAPLEPPPHFPRVLSERGRGGASGLLPSAPPPQSQNFFFPGILRLKTYVFINCVCQCREKNPPKTTRTPPPRGGSWTPSPLSFNTLPIPADGTGPQPSRRSCQTMLARHPCQSVQWTCRAAIPSPRWGTPRL